MIKLNYFYRIDKDGFPVPGSLQRFNQKPTNGRWQQLENNNICCDISSNDIDVFLIAGQSNAAGYAKDAHSPIVSGNSILQVNNGIISVANDPIGVGPNKSSFYSAWPQFGITYNQFSGRKIAFVPTAVGGTGQQQATDYDNGNWSTTGTLFNSSVTKLNSALQTLKTSGYFPTFKGVLWLQGENDALGINDGLATQASYIADFQTMIANYRVIYGTTMPFYIIRIGTKVGADDAPYAQIRDAQETVAASSPYNTIIYRGVAEFEQRGLMQDSFHYKIAGYNEIGRIGASEVINFSQ